MISDLLHYVVLSLYIYIGIVIVECVGINVNKHQYKCVWARASTSYLKVFGIEVKVKSLDPRFRLRVVMATDITDGYNPWIFWNPSSVVNFFGKMENAVVAVIYNCLL